MLLLIVVVKLLLPMMLPALVLASQTDSEVDHPR
jgi:hypothetical protein